MSIEEEDKTKFIATNQTQADEVEDERTRFESPAVLQQGLQMSVANDQPPIKLETPVDSDATLLVDGLGDLANHNIYPIELPTTKTTFEIGDVLKNRFEIIDNLGEGGMGMVFKAIDKRKVEAKSRNPYIAIKVLNPSLAKNDMLVAALQRECEKAQELSHPNIITVYDFDRDGDNVFMSMEFLSGQPLSKLIRDAAPAGGISFQRAWPLIKQMSSALAYAHTRNIVHSDFKPANVIITDEHEVKVLDFGIAAKTEHGNDADATIFNARAEGGHTPPYASFEMMNGAKADPRDDIYALGVVVYEMLTGKHPYNRKPASAVFIEQQQTGKTALVPIKGLSRKQWQALKSAVEILQEKRPKNIDGWLQQLEPRAAQWIAPIASIVGLLVLSVVGYFGYTSLSKPNNNSQSANTAGVAQPVNQALDTVVPDTTRLPIAQPGITQQGRVGQVVRLNGGASQSGDGEPLGYSWRFVQIPAASNVLLRNANSVSAEFTPDRAGDYWLELVVMDKHNSSMAATTSVHVAEPEQALADGGEAEVLEITTSKSRYRIGEQLKINLRIAKAGFLRIAYVGASGEVSELLPNQYQASKVKAGSELLIPPKSAKFKLEITGPVGTDRIVAVFSEGQIPNLEKIVDANGNIADKDKQNVQIKTVEYAVVK